VSARVEAAAAVAARHGTAPDRAHADPHHVPTARLGVWWFLCSEVAVFGGLIACYLLFRFRHAEWGEHAAHTAFAIGLANTLVLLTSSLSVVLAHAAAERGDNARAARRLLVTVVLALVFLALKATEYTREIGHGFVPSSNLFWSFYYLMTGLHGLHVVAGVIAILVVAAGARRGENLQRVEAVGIYWHFVDVIWIFLFPLFYIAR
jgi:heme/copper-type cytochrome/quinol oxidase subunit 3